MLLCKDALQVADDGLIEHHTAHARISPLGLFPTSPARHDGRPRTAWGGGDVFDDGVHPVRQSANSGAGGGDDAGGTKIPASLHGAGGGDLFDSDGAVCELSAGTGEWDGVERDRSVRD